MNFCTPSLIKIAIGSFAILLNPYIKADRIWEFKDGTTEELSFFSIEEGLRSQIVKFTHKEKGFVDCPISELADKEIKLLKTHIATKKELSAKKEWQLKSAEILPAKHVGSSTSYFSDPNKPFHVAMLRSDEGFIHRIDAYFLMQEDADLLLNHLKSNPDYPRQDLTSFKRTKFHISHKKNEQTILLKPIALIDKRTEIIVHSINKQKDHIKNSLSEFEPETIKKILNIFGIRFFQKNYHYSNRIDNYNIVEITEHTGYWQFLNSRKLDSEKIYRCLNDKGEILEVSEDALTEVDYETVKNELNPRKPTIPNYLDIETLHLPRTEKRDPFSHIKPKRPKKPFYFFSYLGAKYYYYNPEANIKTDKNKDKPVFIFQNPQLSGVPYSHFVHYKKFAVDGSDLDTQNSAKKTFKQRHRAYAKDLAKINFTIPEEDFKKLYRYKKIKYPKDNKPKRKAEALPGKYTLLLPPNTLWGNKNTYKRYEDATISFIENYSNNKDCNLFILSKHLYKKRKKKRHPIWQNVHLADQSLLEDCNINVSHNCAYLFDDKGNCIYEIGSLDIENDLLLPDAGGDHFELFYLTDFLDFFFSLDE